MKNKILVGGSSLLLILGGCQSGSKSDKAQDSAFRNGTEQLSVVENEPLQFQLVKIAGKRDTISFEIEKGAWVTVTLSTPADTGNIRINQIIMPDGEMDGPFGKTYTDSLHVPGTYQLIIAESLMAENPYTGEYHVAIEVNND